MGDKSKGQALLEAMESWIGGWVAFPAVPAGQALVAALWALHTWFAPRWPATAYAHITGDGPGVGKSVLLEVLASLSCNPKVRVTLRPLEVVRSIESLNSVVTFFFDEAEKLAHAGASDMRSIMTSGQRQGGKHGISVGQQSIEFSTYCAKAFCSIGDLEEVLRSRSVMFRLTWGVPARSWTDAVMVRQGEADALVAEGTRLLKDCRPEWVAPPFMQGREREIYTPLWSVVLALGLDGPTMKRVRRAFDDFSQFKVTAERKSYRDMVGTESKGDDLAYAVLALQDLAKVLPEASRRATGHVWSMVAVERMKELDGPWRVFQGRGLDADRLAGLVSRFGVKTEMLRMERGRSGQLKNGYRADDVQRALAMVGK